VRWAAELLLGTEEVMEAVVREPVLVTELESEEFVPFRRMALRTKPASVSVEDSSSLITPTPPSPHVLASKNQKGWFWFCTSIGTLRMESGVPGVVFRKPESKPLIVTFVSWAGMQGLLNVD